MFALLRLLLGLRRCLTFNLIQVGLASDCFGDTFVLKRDLVIMSKAQEQIHYLAAKLNLQKKTRVSFG